MAVNISQIIGPSVAQSLNRPVPAAGVVRPKANVEPQAPAPRDTVSLSTQAQRTQDLAKPKNEFQSILVSGSHQKSRAFTDTNRLVTRVVDPITHISGPAVAFGRGIAAEGSDQKSGGLKKPDGLTPSALAH